MLSVCAPGHQGQEQLRGQKKEVPGLAGRFLPSAPLPREDLSSLSLLMTADNPIEDRGPQGQGELLPRVKTELCIAQAQFSQG